MMLLIYPAYWFLVAVFAAAVFHSNNSSNKLVLTYCLTFVASSCFSIPVFLSLPDNPILVIEPEGFGLLLLFFVAPSFVVALVLRIQMKASIFEFIEIAAWTICLYLLIKYNWEQLLIFQPTCIVRPLSK